MSKLRYIRQLGSEQRKDFVNFLQPTPIEQ